MEPGTQGRDSHHKPQSGLYARPHHPASCMGHTGAPGQGSQAPLDAPRPPHAKSHSLSCDFFPVSFQLSHHESPPSPTLLEPRVKTIHEDLSPLPGQTLRPCDGYSPWAESGPGERVESRERMSCGWHWRGQSRRHVPPLRPVEWGQLSCSLLEAEAGEGSGIFQHISLLLPVADPCPTLPKDKTAPLPPTQGAPAAAGWDRASLLCKLSISNPFKSPCLLIRRSR